MNREKIKILIELSRTVEEADIVITENTGLQSIKEKYAFLRGMFDFDLIGRFDGDISEDFSIEMDYYAALNAIINSKWE